MIESEMIHGQIPRWRPPRPCRHGKPARQRARLPAPEPSSAVEPRLPMGAWDRMHRDYQATCPDAPVQAAIQRETSIIPTAVARAVCEEAGRFLGLPLPVEWIAELAEHAEVVYQHNPRFRQLLRRPANAGRDWLWSFIRHWLWGILASRRPDLLSKLPPSYAMGTG